MDRRSFLSATAGVSLPGMRVDRLAAATSVPIIDTHIHLFDPGRPQGVPWPDKNNQLLYRAALPDRYRQVTQGLGIVGAIEVECSPWLEDNQWVLDIAAKDSIVVGTIGDLEPGGPKFRDNLERFHRNPLFRGIRYGNLWGRDLGAELAKTEFISDLKVLASADLVLDTANPTPALIADVVRLTDQVPNLRVIVDHLPQMDLPADATARRACQANLRELGKRPRIYVKISEVLRRDRGKVPDHLDFYRDRLDELWDIFGQDRLLYGSDWPNGDQWGTYPLVLKIVREYFTVKGTAVAEKYFWKNSLAAYHWTKRNANQPSIS
jgi:predicted TIM-barrel fold metal-dependent hydrolase